MHAWLNELVVLDHVQLIGYLSLTALVAFATGARFGRWQYRYSESWKFDCARYQLQQQVQRGLQDRLEHELHERGNRRT